MQTTASGKGKDVKRPLSSSSSSSHRNNNDRPLIATTGSRDSGIPEYNALLDKNLGHRREYLLGKRKSLLHLKKTGCLSYTRTGKQQWAIQIAEMSEKPNTQGKPATQRNAAIGKSVSCQALKTEDTSEVQEKKKTRDKEVLKKTAPTTQDANAKSLKKVKALQREMEMAKQHMDKKVSWAPKQRKKMNSTKERGSELDKLLKLDSTYQLKVEGTKNNMDEIKMSMTKIMNRIEVLRKRVRGVNAVQENDSAVAHCSTVIKRRIAKSEEEHMKTITHRSALRELVNELRRELHSLGSVRQKLETELSRSVERTKGAQEKIKKYKLSFQQVSNEIASVEAEAEEEFRKLHLEMQGDSTDNALDVPAIMNTMQERAQLRNESYHAKRQEQLNQQALATQAKINTSINVNSAGKITENITRYKDAYLHLEKTLGYKSLDDFVNDFETVENDLLASYTHIFTIQEERVKLERKLEEISKEFESDMLEGQQDSENHVSHLENLKLQIVATKFNTSELFEQRHRGAEELAKIKPMLVHMWETLKEHKPKSKSPRNATLEQDISVLDLLGLVEVSVAEIAIANRTAFPDASTSNTVATLKLGPEVPSSNGGKMLQVQPPTADTASITFSGLKIRDEDVGGTSSESMPISPKKLLERAMQTNTSASPKSLIKGKSSRV